MTRLFVLPESPGDQPLELTDKLIVVGREPDNLLQIEDQNVSKHHALLIKVDDTYHVFDLHSANGTYVNDEAVASAKLKDGDVLRFGSGTFRFENRAAVPKIGLKSLAKVPAAPPAAPVAPPPPVPMPSSSPLTAAAPPQPLKAIPRKLQGAPVAAATPAPVVAPPPVPPPAPAAPVGLGARPLLRKPVAPPPVEPPPMPSFPAGADAKETASATIPAPPPEEVAPPAPEEPAKPSSSGEIPQERTLRFKPSGSGGEVRLRLKK
jgi:predicted component of type VI protein secretion system